ncbi:hypothetical protein STPH1_7352 [Streptomyces sp. OM5714]|nr:hypothetical protein STPH1_7352 [Streptomyces sp. OM5714]
MGLKQVFDETQRYLQIYWHPDHIHPKPNYYKAASGVVNIAGAIVYGASSASILGRTLGGAGAIAQALSYYSTNLLPQDAGTYYPPLPTHHHQPQTIGASHQQLTHTLHEATDEDGNNLQPRRTNHVDQPGNPESMSVTPLGSTTLAHAAAMRPTGRKIKINKSSSTQSNSSYADRSLSETVTYGKHPQRQRRNSL